MEDFPTLQGPRNSTMGLEVISPSVSQGVKIVIKSSDGLSTDHRGHLEFIPNFTGKVLEHIILIETNTSQTALYPKYILRHLFGMKSLAGSLHPGHNNKISIETHGTVRLTKQDINANLCHTSQSRAVNLE